VSIGVPTYESTVGAVLSRSAARFPDKLALTFQDRRWTYAELDLAVGRVAAGLLASGLTNGDRVAAFGRNSDAYLLLYLGCARAGLVHVPVNYNAIGEELAYLLTDSEPELLLTDPALDLRLAEIEESLGETPRGSLRHGNYAAVDVLRWALDEEITPHVESGVQEADLVQILYTSGTTSRAKGAMMTHRALVHEYGSCLTALDFRSDDVLLHALPLYHSAQMHVFLVPGLALGATNHIIEAPVVNDIFARIAQDQVTSLFLAPTIWVDVANSPALEQADLSSLKRAYYGASIMPIPILERLQARLPDVGFYNCFGQSEIGPMATVLRPEEHAQRPDSVGRSVLFVQTRVVDSDMNDVAPGELGEVIYRSPQLCTGYWGRPEESAEAFRGGWFHSGDLVKLDAQGYMFVVDRIRDVVNTGGVLVATREVEDVLYRHEAVAEVAVFAVPHERWIEAISAAVVIKAGHQVTADQLVAHVKRELAPHKVPKRVHFLERLPKNAAGKLLKRDLRERYG